MAEEKSNAYPTFNVQVDGVWHQFPKGTRVIEACAQAGVYVPRYCYHKKLSSPGNCPMCDQAGECELQEFSVEYGAAGSRFLENKVKKPKAVQLGPRVTLDDERCILCSRCVRFCNEIAKDDVLGFVDRGSHTVLTAHPGRLLENNYSLNTFDLGPVV